MNRLELFKGLLKAEYWQANKHRLSPEIFPEVLEDLYDTLVHAHEVSPHDITCKELYGFHTAVNKTLTPANQAAVIELIKQVNEADTVPAESFNYLLNSALNEAKANRIANAALAIANGKSQDWDKLEELLRQDVAQEEIKIVSTDVKTISDEISRSYKWHFNIAQLDDFLGPVGPEMFIILAGPVNCGKSAAAVSFVFSPKGFLDQGAKVLYIGNEESLRRTMMRGVSSFTGMTKDEIIADLGLAQRRFNAVKDNLYMIDDYSMTFNKLNYIVNKLKPDIVIIDMLDKVHIEGNFMRSDEKLGRIYEHARELAKRHQCCVFGLSQTSAESFGKLYYSFDRLAGSRVEKGANADTVLLLGAVNSEYGDDNSKNVRVINIAKSKDEGNGKTVNCKIVPTLSRLVS